MSGKGDKKRPGDTEEFNSSWDRIFGKKKTKKVNTEDVEPFHIRNARELVKKQVEWEEAQKKKRDG